MKLFVLIYETKYILTFFLSELASCGADKSVVLWDVSDGRVKRRLRQHAAAVNCVEYNEDSSVIVSGSNDNTVCCWDTRSRNNSPIQVIYLFRPFVYNLIFFAINLCYFLHY